MTTVESEGSAESAHIVDVLTRVETVRPPAKDELVFKDECGYCFHTPSFPGGIYLCLRHFVGLCVNHLPCYLESNEDADVFLHIQHFKIERNETDEPKDKMQRLTIAAEQMESEERFTLVSRTDTSVDIPLTTQALPEALVKAVNETIQHDSATRQQRLQGGSNEWDGDQKVSEVALHLVQLPAEKQIPDSGWKCEEPGCDLEENLWLNLSDGVIKCGRSQYMADGKITKGEPFTVPDCGLGNYHAKKHAEESGFPLVVKLGTIDSNGADVYCYSESESVVDPDLRRHLAHFGLDMDRLTKTEKSTLEMELDLNQKWEWSRCLEDGVTLESAFGPGFTGLINIGSSCYMNSVIQSLCTNDNFVQAFLQLYRTDLKADQLVGVHNDFGFQLGRILHALQSGEYAKENFDYNGIKPSQFKKVAGQGHPEFSTAKQQDAEEYIRHLFLKFEAMPELRPNPVDDFRFRLVKRFQDVASKKVRYTEDDETMLSLPIPKEQLRDVPLPDDLVNIADIDSQLPENQQQKCIDLSQLLQNFSGQTLIDGFVSPITNEPKGALQQFLIASFPEMLLIQVNRFSHDENYQPKKMNVEVYVPDVLDLTPYRFEGQNPDEELLNDSIDVPVINTTAQPSHVQINENYVKELLNLGFSRDGAERALYMTGNSGPDDAAEWFFQHQDDPDVNQPHPDLVKARLRAPESNNGDRDAAELASTLGVSIYVAKYSLEKAGRNLNRAAEWYFDNCDSIPPEPEAAEPKSEDVPKTSAGEPAEQKPPPPKRPVKDGSGRYKLVAFITHMGRSPQSGHYVCHVLRGDNWYLYNDEKVALSKSPPKSMGYIYFYKRA